LRRYTRTDFAALRAFVQRIEPATIARLHYDTGDPERAPHAATPEAMAHYLGTMRDELVRLALVNGSHVLADHLKTSIRKHGSAKLTAVSLRMVEQAAQLAAAAPAHGVGLWFRPLIAQRLISTCCGRRSRSIGCLPEMPKLTRDEVRATDASKKIG
jgi:hypothetical protein